MKGKIKFVEMCVYNYPCPDRCMLSNGFKLNNQSMPSPLWYLCRDISHSDLQVFDSLFAIFQ